VRFAVPQCDAGRLAPGARVQVSLPSLGRALPAVVEQVAPEVDAVSGMILVEARLDPAAASQAGVVPGVVADVIP
jgi:hypothetical protein